MKTEESQICTSKKIWLELKKIKEEITDWWECEADKGLDLYLYQISVLNLNVFFRAFLRNHTYNKRKI